MSEYAGDWEAFVDQAVDAVNDAEEVPEAGEEFAMSVIEKINSISDTVEANERVSAAQWGALKNMHRGIKRWLR